MGNGKDLSPRKKALVEFHLKDTLLSQRDIAKKLSISQKSVSRINRALNMKQSLSPKRVGKCGRKKISPRGERLLVQKVLRNRRVTSRELANDLKESGIEVSDVTVRRSLIANNLSAHRPRKKAKLTPVMAKKRLAWAKEMEKKFGDDWSKVRFNFYPFCFSANVLYTSFLSSGDFL